MELTNYECKLIIDSIGYYISVEADNLFYKYYDMYYNKVNRAIKIASNVMANKCIEPAEARITSLLLDLLSFHYENEKNKAYEAKEVEQLKHKIEYTYAETIANDIEAERQRVYDNLSIEEKMELDDLANILPFHKDDIIAALKANYTESKEAVNLKE